jgi:hypothetical protein
MTPKEKAFELYKMYNNLIIDEVIEMKVTYLLMTNKMAKKAALIAADELIYETQFEVPNIRQRYWIEVKQEIEKIV